MNAIEFIVIQDMTMNDTALYADILLPACHWFETEDLRVRYYCNPYLLWNEKSRCTKASPILRYTSSSPRLWGTVTSSSSPPTSI